MFFAKTKKDWFFFSFLFFFFFFFFFKLTSRVQEKDRATEIILQRLPLIGYSKILSKLSPKKEKRKEKKNSPFLTTTKNDHFLRRKNSETKKKGLTSRHMDFAKITIGYDLNIARVCSWLFPLSWSGWLIFAAVTDIVKVFSASPQFTPWRFDWLDW